MPRQKKHPDPRTLTSPEVKLSRGHHELPTFQRLPPGGVVTRPGSSAEYNTGNWVRMTTCWKKETCINCTLCWSVCPHDAIKLDKDGNMLGVDIEKCTNCGLCIEICPTKPKSLYTEKKEDKKI